MGISLRKSGLWVTGAIALASVSCAPGMLEFKNPQSSSGSASGIAAGGAGAAAGLSSNSNPPTGATYAQAVLADSPTYYWKLDDISGSSHAVESISGANAGIYEVGSGSGGGFGFPGMFASSQDTALLLAGNSDYLTTTTSMSGPNVVSVEIWFNTTTNTGGRIIGFSGNQTGSSVQVDRHIYMTDAGKLVFGTWVINALNNGNGAPYPAISTQSYNDGHWHHVVGTLSAAGTYLYVDGVSSGFNSNTTSESATGYWRIGWDQLSGWPNTPTSPSFAGKVSQAAVYANKALNLSQIQSHYNAGK